MSARAIVAARKRAAIIAFMYHHSRSGHRMFQRCRIAHCVIAVLCAAGPLVASSRVKVARTTRPVSNAAIPDCGGACDPNTMLQFEYFGGKVIPNAKIYAVFWTSTVDATTTSQIGGFYQGLTNSGWMDWLN